MKNNTTHLKCLLAKQILNKKLYTFLFLSLFSIYSFAQAPQLLTWTVPPNTINFIPTTPSVVGLNTSSTYAGDSPLYTANSMCDAAGNLLFFVMDGTVYDKDGNLIDNFIIPSVTSGFSQDGFSGEISIVPVPNSCTSYYLILGVRITESSGGGVTFFPAYAKLDLTLQNINYPLDPTKKGALEYFTPSENLFVLGTVTPTINLFTDYGLHKHNQFGIAVTPFRSATNDYVLFIHGDNGLVSYIVDATGINLLTFPFGATGGGLPIGFLNGSNENYPEMEVVKLASGNYRIGKVSINNRICIGDFDPSTTLLIPGTERYINLPTNTSTSFTITSITGLEFSPDGQKIYYASWNTIASTGTPLGYANLALATPVNVPINYSGAISLAGCNIEMAHNNKMYFNGGTQLYALNTPNVIPLPVSPPAGTWPTVTALPAGGGATYSKLLPDQLDGNIYSGGSAGTIITSYTATSASYFSASTTQTWTPTNNPFGGTLFPLNPVGTLANPIVILDKLIIPAGFNITIQGMRFEFAGRTYDPILTTTPLVAGASVQVLRSTTAVAGGRLTLSNSTFTHTNSCRTGMWEGMEVEGFSTASQGPTSTGKQAWLTVKNSSIVENAYHAVVMARVTNTFNGITGYPTLPAVDLTYSGGVVQVTSGSRFRNNYIDVYFGNYDYLSTSIDNNYSNFDLCTFETTPTVILPVTSATTTMFDLDPRLNLTSWIHHILLGVKGITYRGVTFQNTDPTNPAYDILTNKRGIGMFSINSYFVVSQRFAPPFNRGVFNNLTYGVYAANFGSTKTFSISECDFNDNYRGVYAGSVNYETVIKCNFKVNKWPSSTLPISSDAAYGIYLDFSKGFKIQENDFSYAGLTVPVANSYGVIVNQSNYKRFCMQYDEIYKNNFHSILVGGRAQGNNSENDALLSNSYTNPCYISAPAKKNYLGLEFLCNNFSSNVDNSDLSVTTSQTLTTQGNIAYVQGDFSSSTLTPAGNTFSHTPSAWDFFSQTFPTDVNGTIVYVHHTGASTTPNTFVIPPVTPQLCVTCGTYTTTASCPSKLSGVHTPLILRQEITAFQNQAATLEAKIDGGNTTYLLSQIYGSMPAGTLKNLLISKSPFLSDRVLIAYITKIGVPNGNLKQVVIANSPLTQPVIDALNSISLPTGIRNQIDGAQTGISGRTKLESEISYYTGKRAYNIDELIRTFSNDSTLDNGVDSILTVFKTYNVQQNSTDITLAYLTKGDIPKAILLNDSIKLTGTDTSFTKMVDVAIALKQAIQQENNLLTNVALKTKVDELAAIADVKESPSASAILKLFFNYVYKEYIEPVSLGGSYHSMMAVAQEDESNIQNNQLYPNPSNGAINFGYTLQEGETGTLEILDITGKLIDSYQLNTTDNLISINNTNLNAGTYLYRYLVNGISVKTEKLVIIK